MITATGSSCFEELTEEQSTEQEQNSQVKTLSTGQQQPKKGKQPHTAYPEDVHFLSESTIS